MIGQWTSSGWCCCIKEIKSTTTYEEFHWQNPRIQTKINETKQPVKFSSKVSNTEESTTCWFSKYYALQEDQKSSFRFKAWYYQNGYRDESNQSEDQKAHKESEQKEKDKTKKLFHNADGSIDLFYLKVLHGQHPQSKSMHFDEWLEITKIRQNSAVIHTIQTFRVINYKQKPVCLKIKSHTKITILAKKGVVKKFSVRKLRVIMVNELK